MSKVFSRSLSGFSLIELALVLIVIGILSGAIFKGKDILEAAKIRSVLNDIERIKTAAILYHDTFGQWPGNDSVAKTRFGGDVHNGQGTGLITKGEDEQFWIHLAKAEHLSSENAPTTKWGGVFSVEGDSILKKNFLILSGPDKSGFLLPKQAAALKAKAGESDPSMGQILVTEGKNISSGTCVKDGAFQLGTKTPTCILRVALH